MSRDSIGDFLTNIRNALMVSKREVKVPHSKMREEIAEILVGEGYLVSSVLQKGDKPHEKWLVVTLKYVNGESVIHEIQRVSKPSRRVYASANRIRPVIGGLGVSIVTTPKGVMAHRRAKALKVGGEVICEVW